MTTEQTEITPEEGSESALSETELTTVAPEVLATSLGDYLTAWWRRIKSGESGALPVIAGLIAIIIFFQVERSAFLTDANLVNLFEEAALYILLGAAQTFALLLSEIDLSIGYGMGIAGFVVVELSSPPVNLPWWIAVIGGVAAVGFLGFVQGSLITRIGLPSFIVTLAGQLAFAGIMLQLASADPQAVGGVIQLSPANPVYKLVNSNMSTTLGWIALAVCLLLFAAVTLYRNRSRKARGLHTPPVGVTALTIALVALGGILLMYVCNNNRGAISAIQGMPWVFPFVFLIIAVYSWMMARTRTGRYIYAVGNNKEAARRAGIKVKWIVTFAFIMSGATAALASLVYISTQGNMSTSLDGGSLVLYAVAAAVIGGTTLFGGRGRMVNALLGGLIIAVVYDGLGLMGVGPAVLDIATAIVLLAAVSLDAIVRRRATTR